MILPIWGQDCIVTYREQRVLGQARAPFIDIEGRYRINVYSSCWGYDLVFAPGEIHLLPVDLGSGTKYDAYLAFSQRYSEAQRAAFLAAENTKVPVQVLPVTRRPGEVSGRHTAQAKAQTEIAPEVRQAMGAKVQSIAKPAPKRIMRGSRG